MSLANFPSGTFLIRNSSIIQRSDWFEYFPFSLGILYRVFTSLKYFDQYSKCCSFPIHYFIITGLKIMKGFESRGTQ